MQPETVEKLGKRVKAALTPREAAVDVMKELQNHYGWLTDEAVQEAAELLSLSTVQVDELATFYEMLYRRPVGKKIIHVCDSISCWAMGGETLLAHMAARLGIEPGQTSEDGMFTLLPCACLGMCGDGPAVMIGKELFGRVTPERAVEILEHERRTHGLEVTT